MPWPVWQCQHVHARPAPRRLPEGPYADTLQVLHADGITSTPGQPALPRLPALRQLSWGTDTKLKLPDARTVLASAPELQTLWYSPPLQGITAPARKALEGAGVSVDLLPLEDQPGE